MALFSRKAVCAQWRAVLPRGHAGCARGARPQGRYGGLVAALAAALLVVACDGGGTPPPSSPAPSPGPGPAQNPCPPSVEEPAALVAPGAGLRVDKHFGVVYGDTGHSILDSVWLHELGLLRGLIRPIAPQAATEDVGEIAVLKDEGDLVLQPNAWDLRNLGLRFTPNEQGGYDVRRIEGTFRQALGQAVTLGDDDSVPVTLPFSFAFYGRRQVEAFVNSDGNLTFGEADRATTPRDITRLLTGPPRIAPLLADLDPSAGGQVFVDLGADAFTVTYCGVRFFQSQLRATAQATLAADGTVEMKFADDISLDRSNSVIVGLSPGRTGQMQFVDLSAEGPTRGGAAAVGERFSLRGEVDFVALARKFYQTHPDIYDQLVIWADQLRLTNAFAFELPTANEIRGIGIPVFEAARDFGSAGRLRSLVMMDWLGKYPDDPTSRVPDLGENTTLSVLGQEVGHRWLAFLKFVDHNRQVSDALLGRDRAHWSFFFDSDASVMEGNDIEDLGGGSFRTVAAVQRYSALDQYAMGLRSEREVAPFFYVEGPTNVTPFKRRESGPQVGVTFNGTRREVLIQDVISAMGPRQPSAAESPRVLRQAFIYLVGQGRAVDEAEVAKLDRIRREWEGFFLKATDGRMRAETRLRASS
jgi:hypothetical protein